LTGIAWPVVILILVLIFKSKVSDLLGRVAEAEGFGLKAKFDPAKAEPAVAVATATAVAQAGAAIATGTAHDATVKTRESLVSKLGPTAEQDPRLAVLAAWSEVEKVLLEKMREANIAHPERVTGQQLVDTALRKGAINRQTAEAIRGLLTLRNLAAHGQNVETSKANEYLALCDAVIYAIETGPGRGE
jgi:hypothetical protein